MKKTHAHAKSVVSFASMGPANLYSEYTPADIFDLRCEYEVPRYFDFNVPESTDIE